MSATFDQIWREAANFVPRVDPKQAQKFVTRAFRDVCEAYPRWSFLTGRTGIAIPSAISVGTVAVTRNSSVIQFDAAATAALDAANPFIPVTERQLQISGGAPYSILTYEVGVGTATISPSTPATDYNPGYLEATASASAYQVLKCYYAPPNADFLRWTSVINALVPYQLWLNVQIQSIDLYDPKRMITGNPYVMVQFAEGLDPRGSGEQVPLYELWPHPTAEMTLQATYQKRGSSLFALNADQLPNAIPSDLLMERVKYRCYEWAAANAGRFQELKGTNWSQLMRDSYAEYKADLWKYKKQDKETYATATVIPNRMGYYPLPFLDASQLQYNSMAADFIWGATTWP